MKPPINSKPGLSSSDKTKVIVVIVFLAILLLIFGLLVGLLLRQNGFQFSLPGFQATQAPVIPTMFIPTPDCGQPTLSLGSSIFQIKTVQPAADDSLAVPTDTSGIAYWIDGTNTNYVFVLSPMPENLAAMNTLATGSTAKVTWSNCNSTTYSLSAPQQGSFSASALPNQSTEGITVFFQTDISGAGFVYTGDLTEQQIMVADTPAPGELNIQANIGLLEMTSSPDRTTIKIGVSINNYGKSPLALSASDVSLIQQDSTPLQIVSSEPALPKEIAPGTTETVYLTFPRPSSTTATLTVLTVEYDIEGY